MTVRAAGQERDAAGDKGRDVENDIAGGDLGQPLGIERVQQTMEDGKGRLNTDGVVVAWDIAAVGSNGDCSKQN